MLYNLLYPHAHAFGLFNLFKYQTFRSGGAALTSLVVTLLIGPHVIRWLKAKQPNLFTNQVWLYYLNRYAQQFSDTPADRTKKEESIMAILDANPHLKVDEETANNIYNQCSCGYRGIAIQQRVYPNTSWHYSVVPLLEFLFLSPRQSARPARILTDELDTPIASATSRPTTGENAV